jgi:hypothetical protein
MLLIRLQASFHFAFLLFFKIHYTCCCFKPVAKPSHSRRVVEYHPRVNKLNPVHCGWVIGEKGAGCCIGGCKKEGASDASAAASASPALSYDGAPSSLLLLSAFSVCDAIYMVNVGEKVDALGW